MTRVLVVEDSRTQAEQLRLVLESAGYEVAVARDGEEALQRLRAGRFDLVLSDVVMPRMDGYTFCRTVKDDPALASTPVVLLTSLNEPMDVLRGLECGADNFVTKPYEVDVLLGRVQHLLANRSLRAGRRVSMGVDLLLMGRKFTITSEREQILDLLMSTFEEVLRARHQEFETRLARATLEQSNQFLRSVLDALPARIAIVEPDGLITETNASWRRFVHDNRLDWPDEGEGADLLGLYAELMESRLEDHQRLSDGLAALARGEVDDLQVELPLRIVGARCWHALTATRLAGPGPVRLVVSHEDVTRRRLAEHRRAVQLAVTDILGGAEGLTDAAPRLLQAIGEGLDWEVGELWTAPPDADRPQLTASWCRDIFDGGALAAAARRPDFEAAQSFPGQVWRTGQTVWTADLPNDPRFPRRDLARRLGLRGAIALPLMLEGSMKGAITFMFRDAAPPDPDLLATLGVVAGQIAQFAERRRTQEAMAERERAFREQAHLLRLILDSMADAVVVADPQGRIVLTNAAAERLTATPTGPTVDIRAWREAFELFEADGATPLPEAALPLQRALRGETTDAVDLVARHRAGGPPVHLLVSARPLIDDDGASLGGVAVLHDMTVRRQMEEALRQSEERYRQAQKMEAIGRLAGGVAHDFNNLLVVILTCVDLLAQDLPAGTSPQAREDLADIRNAAERASELTRQLLAFSRRQVLKPTSVNLAEVVRGLERMLQRILGEDIDVVVRAREPVGAVMADPGQLEQVVMNLAVNARDAMPDGGRLTIHTREAHLDGPAARAHPGANPGRYVMLEVSDTGVGMDEATRARAFEPFFTTKPVGQGTGLGLATVHGIVEQSGGHLELDSELGAGTTFRIWFPRHEPDDRPVVPRSPAPPAVERGARTVLLVEDDATVRAVATRILRQRGFAVHTAADGHEALQMVTAGLRADLLLTDIVMPGLNGPELAARVRALHPEARVLFMSGYAPRLGNGRDLLPPDADFLEKPFTPASLVRAVEAALGAVV